MKDKAIVGLDYSHDNKLVLEASSYSEFTQFLFTSGFKLGKIQAGFDSLQKLENYDLIVLSSPRHKKLDEEEIENLVEYVKNGGNLLVVSTTGGDYKNKTNLNELTEHFGFKFNSDTIHDSMSYINLQKRPLYTKFTPHMISEQIQKVVLSSACSLEILDFIEDDKDIKIEEIIEGGLNCWRKRYDEEKKEWIREDSPKIPMLVAVDYFEGNVIGFGTLSIFSSLGREYGFSAFDNNVLIANVFRWLTFGGITEGKTLTLILNLQLYYWAKAVVDDENWDSLSDLINVSLKYFKDNYKDIIEEIKKLRKEKQKRKEAYEKAKKEKDEEEILELVPKRDKKDLEDIMSALQEATGEDFEFDIDDIESEFDTEDLDEEELEEIKKKAEQENEKEKEEKEESEKKKDDEDKGEGGAIKEKEEKEEDNISKKKEQKKTEKKNKKKESEKKKGKQKDSLNNDIKNALEKQSKNLESKLDKDFEKEKATVIKLAEEEISEELNADLEAEKSNKIKKSLEKEVDKEIKNEKQKIINSAQKKIEDAKKSILKDYERKLESSKESGKKIEKEVFLSEAIEEIESRMEGIIQEAGEQMQKEREKRIKKIKARELEILKKNEEFLEDILEATKLFDSPDLNSPKKKQQIKEED